MGRTQKHRVNRDKNTQKLPQTPRRDIVSEEDRGQFEIANELSDRYELKARPGFAPAEVNRKDQKK